MSHSPAWQAARAARAARRAQDPAAQERRRQHEAAQAVEERRVHLSTLAAAWPKPKRAA